MCRVSFTKKTISQSNPTFFQFIKLSVVGFQLSSFLESFPVKMFNTILLNNHSWQTLTCLVYMLLYFFCFRFDFNCNIIYSGIVWYVLSLFQNTSSLPRLSMASCPWVASILANFYLEVGQPNNWRKMLPVTGLLHPSTRMSQEDSFKWVISPTHKWGYIGVITQWYTNLLLNFWDIQVSVGYVDLF